MHCSELFKLPQGHGNFDFVDIDLHTDTRLFIDPVLVDAGSTDFCRNAKVVLQDCMDYLVSLYSNRVNDAEKLRFFDHMHELNYTKLGYGNGHNGKAKTAEGMLETLRDLQRLVDDAVQMQSFTDLVLFISGFAEDCLSDMITNILFSELCAFTVSQCKKYGIPTERCKEAHYYWDVTSHEWLRYEGDCLYYEGKPILLVPKNIVDKRYRFDAGKYFNIVVLKKLQNDMTENGAKKPPSKKDLRKKLLKDKSVKDISREQTRKVPYLLERYHQTIRSANTQPLTDSFLDSFVYLSARKNF